jgi:peptide/nickel transport system substrate-binding protein
MKQNNPAVWYRRLPARCLFCLALIGALLITACGSAPPDAAVPPASNESPVAEAPLPSNESPDAEAPPAPDAPADSTGAATTFRIAVGVDPSSLEPVTLTGAVANMMDYVLEPLVGIGDDGSIQPKLAESWEVSADRTTVTFALRQGVTFQDGAPLDAEAVKFSFDRWLNPEIRPPNVFVSTLLREVTVVDANTVAIMTGFAPDLLLNNLAWTGYAPISPDSVNQFGNTNELYVHPVGTGPYAFKELAKGERLILERYAEYWGEAPYYDTVEFRVAPEAATRASLLLAGQVDMLLNPPVSDLPALQQNPQVQVQIAPGLRMIYIGLNTAHPALADPRVRQALNYAIDKEAITKNLLFDAADPLDSPLAAALSGYCQTGPYAYDPDKARSLLAEAGVTDLTLEFIAPTGRYLQDFQVAQAVGGYLSEVGVTAAPKTMDWPSYLGLLFTPPQSSTVQLHYFGFAATAPDAGQPMYFLLHSSQAAPRGVNTAYYSNEQYDQLIDAASRETDPAQRQELYCQAQQLVWEDAPWIFLFTERFPIVHSANVENIVFRPGEKFDAIYARPKQ